MKYAEHVRLDFFTASEQTPEGERGLRYQSGLLFVHLTAEEQAALASIFERLTTQAKVLDKVPRQRKTRAHDR